MTDGDSLVSALGRLGPGDHLCLIYRSREEQLQAAIPFIALGLDRGERCLYVADENTVDGVVSAMERGGVDVDQHRSRGALVLATKRESYLRQGHFDPDWMIQFLRVATEDALRDGFTALRVTGEMTWALADDPGAERLLEYENKLNQFFPGSDALAICQYNAHRFDPETLLGVVETHPLVVHEGTVCWNPYYTPPEEGLQRADALARLDRELRVLVGRAKADNAIRDSEAQLQALFDSTADAIYVCRPDGAIVRANEQAARDTGYSPEELTSCSILDLAVEDSPERLASMYQELAAGESIRLRGTHRRKDATEFPVEVTISMFETSAGPRIIAVARDVTERIERETEYAEVLCTARDGFWIIDEEGRILDANPAAAAMLGYTSGEMLSMSIADVEAIESREDTVARLVHVRKTGHARFETKHRRKDGVVIDVEVSTSYLPLSRGRFLAFIRDITDRKQSEEALRRSEERFQRVFQRAPLMMTLSTVGDGRYLDVNDAFVDVTGYSREQAVGRTSTELGFISDADRERLLCDVRAEGRVSYMELTLKRADGSAIECLYSGELIEVGGETRLLSIATDLTERRRAEDEARATRQILADGERLAGMGAWRYDVTTDRWWFSDNWLAIHGCSEPPVAMSDLMPIAHPEDAAIVERAFRGALEAMASYEVEHRIIRQDTGEVRVVRAHGEPLADGDGRVVELRGAALDITSSKQVERSLAESEAALRRLYNSVLAGVVLFDASGGIISVNEAGGEILGMTPGDVQRRTVDDGVWDMTQEDGAPVAGSDHPSMITLRTGEPIRGAVRCLFASDPERARWLLINTEPVHNDAGVVSEVLVTFIDVTDLKRAEEQLREREERFRQVFDHMASGVAIYDVVGDGDDFVFADINPAGSGTGMLSRQQHIGRSVQEVYPGVAEFGLLDVMREVWRDGSPRYHPVSLYEDDRINQQWFENYVCKLPTGQIMAVYDDVTARIENEREQARLQTELAQAQRMESIGRLAGGVAHDFNNMLNVILGNVELALGQVEEKSQLEEDLREIEAAAERSARLTQQLLAFARKQAVSPEVIDVNEAAARSLRMIRRLIGEDIEVAWSPGDELPPVWMDPGQIDQILANLAVNARDAIEGTGTVTIETRTIHVDTGSDLVSRHENAQPGDYVLMTFSDSGAGMDAETLAHVFEPFYTTKPLGEGTGLGLATVHGIVEQNMGFIEVDSQPGEGATFRIYLPRHQGPTDTAEVGAHEVDAGRGHGRVLLVEDEPALLRLTKAMLEQQGYAVRIADSPSGALAQASVHGHRLDVLITDVIMPGMNGNELARELTASHPEIAVLYISGYPFETITQRGTLPDGAAFLRKPFAAADLGRAVRRLLDVRDGGRHR
ncbi:MAG: PAS domain S-box protein [Armatimonadia bacterium]|nr:PAS domain S-box protein [Armatimonadia bacterium]